MLDVASGRLTVRNTGDSNLADCTVGITKPDAPLDFTPLGQGNWLDKNQVTIAVLHPGESIEIPLSTFLAYRDRSIFSGQHAPFASVSCWENKTHQAFSSVDLPRVP
jgi:hypothetical protein